MDFAGVVELLSLTAAACALLHWLLSGRNGLRVDCAVVLLALIFTTGLLGLGRALPQSRLAQLIAPARGYLTVVQCILWAFLVYAFVQGAVNRRLREAERHEDLLLRNVPQRIYFKDPDLVYVSVNDQFARAAGRPVDQIVGKTDYDLYPPDVADRYRAGDLRVLDQGLPETIVQHVSGKDGTTVTEVTRIPIEGERGEPSGLLGMVADVTERKRTREALRKSEGEKEAILDSMSEVVVYHDTSMRVLWSNRAAAEALNLQPGQLTGRHCYSLWQSADEPCLGCPVADALEAGSPAEKEMTSRDGRHWRIRAYPVTDAEGTVQGAVEVAEDITERKRAQSAYARLAAIVEASEDAIIGTTPSGVITDWNVGAECVYGFDDDQVVGRPLADLLTDSSRKEFEDVLQKVAAGQSAPHHEVHCCTRDGRVLHVSMTLSPMVDDAGSVEGISVIARDITEQVRLRRELRVLSLVDALTDLHNRRGFFHLASQQLKVASRTGQPMLLLFIDIDGLKTINDGLGHNEGDQALKDAAEVLRGAFRESDITARIGGDEFAVLALDAAAESRGYLRERIAERINRHNAEADRPYDLSVSVGTAVHDPKRPTTLDELLAEADARMYEEKRAKSRSRATWPSAVGKGTDTDDADSPGP